MTIVKRNGTLLNNFPALFDDFFRRDLSDWATGNFSGTNTTLPAVNIRETNNSFEVEMAAPGMRKEDFTVELENNLLTISAEPSSDNKEKEDGKYSRREFSYQAFQRSFTLPKEVVDSDKINGRYEHGVLLLTIPKKEEAKLKPARVTPVS